MRYTIEELEWLRDEQYKQFKKNDPNWVEGEHIFPEDEFFDNTEIFINWLKEKEASGKIQFLLTECRKNIYEHLQ